MSRVDSLLNNSRICYYSHSYRLWAWLLPNEQILGKGCSFDSFCISSVASQQRICHGGITGVAQPCKRLLTFEGTATDSESSLHSTFIHAILLLRDMCTRPRHDANDSLFVLWPWCNAIRVRTPPEAGQRDTEMRCDMTVTDGALMRGSEGWLLHKVSENSLKS